MENKFLWIDATDFQDRGEWILDTQFTHLMGSPYLLAVKTPGTPVADATATAEWEGAKMVRVWVRTKNWYHPYAPGIFNLEINGVKNPIDLGDSPTHDWYWQLAGDFSLEKGKIDVKLCDKTGYFGRAAAILITDDMDYVPPRPVDEYKKARAYFTGKDLTPKMFGDYDVVVCGAGPGGVPAAIAAARHGAKTLLISGRPVIGGNASDEAGVGFNGASSRQFNAREGGIGEEIVRGNYKKNEGWTSLLMDLCNAEENLTLICNYFVNGAETVDGTIKSITAMHVETNEQIIITGKQFIDCSGDGWLGYHAGAKYRLGREAKWQYNEEFAPEVADTRTMSGCIMMGKRVVDRRPGEIDTGKEVKYGRGPIFLETDKEVSYVAPEWVPKFPKGDEYGRNIEGINFHWWLEAPNIYDDIYDAEMARDELFRILLGHFNYIKNLWNEKERAKNYIFNCMPFYDAKRESRRFVGDYVLTQNDCMEGKDFPDTVSHTGWPIDLHNPKGIYSGKEGPFFSNTHIPLTKVPFRSLYSANINNLLFAGRCASVSHIALGTCRIENTIACEGQAVGTAAAICCKDDISPRELCKTRIEELQQILIKDDQYIPGRISTDEKDIARRAEVTASSEKDGEIYYEHIGREFEGFELDKQRATFFARDVADYIGSVWTKLSNKTDEEKTLLFHVRLQADPDGYVTEDDICTCTVVLPPNSTDWYEIKIDVTTKLRYLWMWTDKNPGVWWHAYEGAALDHTRSERDSESEEFKNMRWITHAVQLTKPDIRTANCSAKNIINGYSRANDHINYEWVSDPDQGLPQWIELKLDKQQPINKIHVTLDTDMTNPSMLKLFEDFPSKLVKAYTVEVNDGNNWIQVAEVKDNWFRRINHKFDTINATAVRINVTESGDGVTARIFEVRIYNE